VGAHDKVTAWSNRSHHRHRPAAHRPHPRSNPATYTKLFDLIREVFADTKEARAFGSPPVASPST